MENKKVYPKDFWILSRALRLHFDSSTNYDAVQFHYKLKHVPDSTFEKSNSFHRSIQLAKKCQNIDTARRYITANNLEGNSHAASFKDECYIQWLSRMESITYHVNSQVKDMVTNFDDLFVIKDTYPLIIEKLFEKKCSYETVACINKLTKFIQKVEIKDPLVWPEIKYKLQQYTTLFIMDVNLNKIRRQLVNTFK